MQLPSSYAIRNLRVRKTTSLMTGVGITLSVAILVASIALVDGLRTVFANTANPMQLLVLRKGATSELGSSIATEALGVLKVKSGIAVDGRGEPMVSPEVVNVANIPSVDDPKGMNLTVRGLTPVGIAMRTVEIINGRWFHPGQNEVVVGRAAARRYPSAQLGRTIRFGKSDWTIVGVMDGGESAVDSEIWGDFDRISADFNRQDIANAALVRAVDASAVDPLRHSLDDDPRLNASAIPQREYYESQTVSGAPLEFLGILVAVMMAIGSGFATANTMYAAVARRSREVGTLRTLGFSKTSILGSFLLEAVVLSVCAGLAGCVLAFPLNFVTTGVGSMASFSEIAFRFRVGVGPMLIGLAFATALGALGGLLPARAAASRDILAALTEV